MAYGSNRNNGRYAPYNNNYQNNNKPNYGSAKPIFKKSGFGFKAVDRKGLSTFVCWGWKKNRNGIIKIYAQPYSKTKKVKSKANNVFHNLMVKVTNTSTGQQNIVSGMFNETTRKLTIPELGWVGSPNGGGQTASGKLSKGTLTKIR